MSGMNSGSTGSTIAVFRICSISIRSVLLSDQPATPNAASTLRGVAAAGPIRIVRRQADGLIPAKAGPVRNVFVGQRGSLRPGVSG